MVSEFVRRCKQAKFNKQASPHPINEEGEIFWQIWTIHAIPQCYPIPCVTGSEDRSVQV